MTATAGFTRESTFAEQAQNFIHEVGGAATVIAHIIRVDGTIVRDDPKIAGSLVEKEPIVGFLFLGFHYERATWGIHFQHVITSDFVKANSASASDDLKNTFSSISFEWLRSYRGIGIEDEAGATYYEFNPVNTSSEEEIRVSFGAGLGINLRYVAVELDYILIDDFNMFNLAVLF